MRKGIAFFGLLLAMGAAAQDYRIASPNGQVAVQVARGQDGALSYGVRYKNKTVLLPSGLGIALSSPKMMLTSFDVDRVDSSTHDATWKPVWGEYAQIRDHHKELKLWLRDKANAKVRVNIVFRVFDEGVGFRYEFPEGQELMHFVVANERTEFNLPADPMAHWIPGDYETNEYTYQHTRLSGVNAITVSKAFNEISTRQPFSEKAVQTPLMLKTDDGLYINIHEAALVNYPAMQLEVGTGLPLTLKAHLVPDAVGNKAYLQTPSHTPWRTIIVSDKATEIIAANRMVLNLNEPSKVADPSFIRPQKFVGVWWEMHVGKGSWDYAGGQVGSQQASKVPHSANTANVKRYIDFAAKNGFGGVLVEGWNTGWEDWFGKWKENVFDFITPYPDYDVNELQRYAASKGVKIIMHHETSGSVTNYERYMDTAYRFMRAHGMDAVKTGYVGLPIPRGEHHDGQWMVNHYLRVAEKTAGYRIMVDAHEPVRPTGLHRTWPNWLASEAARGNEFNAWSKGNPPEHETILPFTRLMGGPMDYTPGIFQIRMSAYDPKKTEQVHTTLAKQLALYVTMYSPLQMAADLPENYEAKPDAFQFIRDVAVDWDDTKVLQAEPGDYLVIARKAKGSANWFLGGITDEQARSFRQPLDFLEAGKTYIATIYRDDAKSSWDGDPMRYVIEQFLVDAKTALRLSLAPGGGVAISMLSATGDTKGIRKYKTTK